MNLLHNFADRSLEFDFVSLGEVMLRFDPRESRIRSARQFDVWEGGGEYNVSRSLHKTFGMNTAIVTSLVQNEIGLLIQDLISQGGVNSSLINWVEDDGMGKRARNGIYFLEKGFGIRGALGCSDRANTAISQLKPGDVDWDDLFSRRGVRWFHTGGIQAALSDDAADLAIEGMKAARKHHVTTSFDLNYRASLWKGRGGKDAARCLNEKLVKQADVLFGVEGIEQVETLDSEAFEQAIQKCVEKYPNLKLVASTKRIVNDANNNDWSGLCYSGGRFYHGKKYLNLPVYDRVGSGDGFAAGLIYSILMGLNLSEGINLAVAHGALAMSTPGDNSMSSLDEVVAQVKYADATVNR